MFDNFSRRNLAPLVLGVAAFVGMVFNTTASLSDFFVPTDKEHQNKPLVSFSEARSFTMELLKSEIESSQKDFDTKYTPEQIGDIQQHIWENTQLAMLAFYRPKEAFDK